MTTSGRTKGPRGRGGTIGSGSTSYNPYRLAEIEFEFTVDDVPNAVLNAIDETLPEFKAECFETGDARSLHVIACDVMGSVGGNEIDIDVSADSRRMIVTEKNSDSGRI